MKRIGFFVSLVVVTVLLTFFLSSPQIGWAQTDVTNCSSTLGHVTAVSLPAAREATIDFAGGGQIPAGSFDPIPLLNTTIELNGRRPSCLIAHFSNIPQPADNHIVYQVRVDGIPMEGHHPTLFGFGTAAVSDPNRTDEFFVDVPRMASYTFFATIEPGEHTVEVLFAGCCSGTTGYSSGSVVAGATLTLQYR